MKTMLMFDLLTAKKLAWSQLLIVVAVALILTVSTGSAITIMLIMTLMPAYSVGFTLIAFDERNGWERFRLTLPLSRASVMQGRYATFVVITLAGLVLGMALTAIVYGLSLAFPNVELLSRLFEGMGWQMAVATIAASVAFSLVLWLIVLPLFARFGMTKAVRYLPLALIVLLPIGTVLVQKAGPLPAFVLDLAAWASTPTGTVALVAAVLAVTAVLTALSCMLSVKLYERREF